MGHFVTERTGLQYIRDGPMACVTERVQHRAIDGDCGHYGGRKLESKVPTTNLYILMQIRRFPYD